MTNINYQTTSGPASPSTGIGYTPQTSALNPGQPSNVASVPESKTRAYFNNFFVKTTAISIQANDSIVSYFEQQTRDRAAARIMAQAVLNTASQQGDDPLKVLDEFKKMPVGELNSFLALYLNATRVNTSLLGVQKAPPVNKYVARTILP